MRLGEAEKGKFLLNIKENFMDRKVFHSENVIIHLTKANSA